MFVVSSAGMSPSALGQPHLSPQHGSEGIESVVARSFVIEWGAVPGAVAYEYVLSDNPLCFEGCPGDTRQAVVQGTSAIEYNLQVDTWYYWITRVYVADQPEPTVWTGITSFFARSRAPFQELMRVTPNPVRDGIRFEIDWSVVPNAQFGSATVFDVLGRRVQEAQRIERTGGRYQKGALRGRLVPGFYLTTFVVDGNPNNPNNSGVVPFVVR